FLYLLRESQGPQRKRKRPPAEAKGAHKTSSSPAREEAHHPPQARPNAPNEPEADRRVTRPSRLLLFGFDKKWTIGRTVRWVDFLPARNCRLPCRVGRRHACHIEIVRFFVRYVTEDN